VSGLMNLGDEVVLVDMKTVTAFLALHGHPGAHHLGEPIDIESRDVEFLFDLLRIFSLQGSAPRIPTRSLRISCRPPSPSPARRDKGIRGRAADGRGPKSWRIMIWRFVFPPDMGMTLARASPPVMGPETAGE